MKAVFEKNLADRKLWFIVAQYIFYDIDKFHTCFINVHLSTAWTPFILTRKIFYYLSFPPAMFLSSLPPLPCSLLMGIAF